LYIIKSKNDFLDVKEENILFLGILFQDEKCYLMFEIKENPWIFNII